MLVSFTPLAQAQDPGYGNTGGSIGIGAEVPGAGTGTEVGGDVNPQAVPPPVIGDPVTKLSVPAAPAGRLKVSCRSQRPRRQAEAHVPLPARRRARPRVRLHPPPAHLPPPRQRSAS